MAADLDQAYVRWSHEELSDPSHSQETSIAQMLDHGSISFGRYAVETLAWEKRSVFTHNRCQEELEKFKAPGLVAQKKAYFEEYYKKIRAMKALADDDQQTEVTLDYGGDSSISSQMGEDDETAVQIRNPRASIATTSYGGRSFEVAIEQEKNSSNALLNRQLGSEAAVSYSDSLSRCSDEIDLEKNSIYVSQITQLGLDVKEPYLDSQKRKSNLIKLEKNSSDVSQITHLDFDARMMYLDSPERNIEEVNLKNSVDDFQRQHEPHDCSLFNSLESIHDANQRKIHMHNADGNESLMKDETCVSTFEPCGSSQATALDPTMSETSLSGLPPALYDVSEQEKAPYKKNEEHSSLSKMKEPSASIGNQIKPGNKTKSDPTKPPHRGKYLYQKTIEKEKRVVSSNQGMCTAVLRNTESCSISSCKQKEVRSNVTVPRPFSFATERRATTERRPATPGLRGVNEKFDFKTTNRSVSSVQTKGLFASQINSKRTAVPGATKSTNFENNRHWEMLYTKPSVMESQQKNIKGSDVVDRPKPWPINPPSSERPFSSRSSSGHRNQVRGGKEEGEAVAKKPISKPATPPMTRKQKTEVKKMVSPRSRDLAVNEKKPRLEVKRWR